jgi:hypothetical protein
VSHGEWAALEALIGRTECPKFMYMGRSSAISHQGGAVQLYFYKHIETRRYLNVAKDGTCFRYIVEGYIAVARNEAIAHAFS